MNNSASPCVGRLEALRQRRVVVDENVRGGGLVAGVPGSTTSAAGEEGRGVREALVTVLTLTHPRCTVICGGKDLIKCQDKTVICNQWHCMAECSLHFCLYLYLYFAFCALQINHQKKNSHCPDMGRLNPSASLVVR